MIGAAYSRISTSGQEEGTSLETQFEICMSAATADGCQVPPEFMFREIWTGADIERPQLTLLRAAARAGKLEALYILSTDRLSREPIDLLMLVKEFEENGVRVVFVQGISDSSPEGQLLMFVQGYASQKERMQTAERTMRGKRAVAESGRLPNGTGAGLYGYDYDSIAKVRTINEEEAVVVLQANLWAVEGVSVYQIAVRFNEKNIPTKQGKKWFPIGILRMLRNRAYTGVQTYGENRYRKKKGGGRTVTPRPEGEVVIIEGFTPQIISHELYSLVQKRLDCRQAKVERVTRLYFLTGHLSCWECGGPVVGATQRRKYIYYRCRHTAPTASMPAKCHAGYIPGAKLEELVWRKMTEAILDPALLVAELEGHFKGDDGSLVQAMKDLKKEIINLKGQQQRLMELRQKDIIDLDLLEHQIGPIKLLCDERERTLQVLEEQQRQRDEVGLAERRVVELCNTFSEKLKNTSFEGKRATLGAFNVKTRVNRENISITMEVNPKFTTTERTWALQRGRSLRNRWA